MSRNRLWLLSVFTLVLLSVSIPLNADSVFAQEQEFQLPANNFEVEKIAEGVYALIRKEPAGLMFNANIVFIISDSDVVVVDTNITPTSAREAITALRKLTDKPVRYVINTHWHPDHISGNQVYRDTFPGVEFIAQKTTLEDLPAVGESNRKQLLTNGPGFAAQLRKLAAGDKSLGGWELTEDERVSYLSDASQVEALVKEASSIEIMLPTITIEDRLTLYRGSRTIDIRYLGRAHTRADLVVYLPQEGIVVTGDIVVWPVPLVGSTSYPIDYASTLENLLNLRAKIFIPGHGKVLRDDSYIRTMARLLTSIKEQTQAAAARGETLEQARKSINLDEFRKLIAGESKLLRFIFAVYVTDPGIAAAYAQATGKR